MTPGFWAAAEARWNEWHAGRHIGLIALIVLGIITLVTEALS